MTTAPRAASRPIDVLLVEDSAGDALLTSEMLEAVEPDGIRTTHVGNLREAEARVAHGTDVVLLDLQLPDSAGLETVIRLHSVAPDVPMVVLTGLHDEHMALQAVRYGAQDYLVKGRLDPQSLVRAIHHAIGRSEMVSDLESALRHAQSSESSFRGIITGSADGLVVIDRDGRVLFANPAAEDILGRESADLVGRPLDLPVALLEPVEIRLPADGGDARVLQVRTTETVWEGRPAYVASLYDLSERRRAEDDLRRSADRLRQVQEAAATRSTADVAREFDNLLTVITGYANYLLEDLEPDEDLYHHARAILRAARKAERLVGRLGSPEDSGERSRADLSGLADAHDDAGGQALPAGTETLLVVAEGDALRTVVGGVLRRCGYTVLEADRPAAALRIAERSELPIDVLLTDVSMPGLPGRQLADLVSCTQPRIRVIYMSGLSDDTAARKKALDSGAPFVQKPFTPRALALKVREVLDS